MADDNKPPHPMITGVRCLSHASSAKERANLLPAGCKTAKEHEDLARAAFKEAGRTLAETLAPSKGTAPAPAKEGDTKEGDKK